MNVIYDHWRSSNYHLYSMNIKSLVAFSIIFFGNPALSSENQDHDAYTFRYDFSFVSTPRIHIPRLNSTTIESALRNGNSLYLKHYEKTLNRLRPVDQLAILNNVDFEALQENVLFKVTQRNARIYSETPLRALHSITGIFLFSEILFKLGLMHTKKRVLHREPRYEKYIEYQSFQQKDTVSSTFLFSLIMTTLVMHWYINRLPEYQTLYYFNALQKRRNNLIFEALSL